MSIWEDTIGDKYVSFAELINELTNIDNYSSNDNEKHKSAIDHLCKISLLETLAENLQSLKSSIDQTDDSLMRQIAKNRIL